MLQMNSLIELNNGKTMPRLGLGVYEMRSGAKSVETIAFALKNGYRHLDTASLYNNEAEVGEAVRASGLSREDVFVTTKLWNSDHGYDSALRAFEKSLKLMKFDYVDLYLIHWPVPQGRQESWRALEKLYEEGSCKAIGVSNYMVQHIDELNKQANVIPAVNQIELHPFNYAQRKPVIELCQKHNICVECYSPLTKGVRLRDPGIVEFAKRYDRSTAQVLIRWGLQKGFVTIPKSARPERIIENANVFDFSISEEDLTALDTLNEDYSCTWDPTDEP
jgi:diketogulonate reductase-like aldo/keto reductase